ncbi:MAG: RsiV family protein [Candidatus Spyradosoma sp.]
MLGIIGTLAAAATAEAKAEWRNFPSDDLYTFEKFKGPDITKGAALFPREKVERIAFARTTSAVVIGGTFPVARYYFAFDAFKDCPDLNALIAEEIFPNRLKLPEGFEALTHAPLSFSRNFKGLTIREATEWFVNGTTQLSALEHALRALETMPDIRPSHLFRYVRIGNIYAPRGDFVSASFYYCDLASGVHSDVGIFALTLDMKNGKKVSLADLFRPGFEAPLTKLLRECDPREYGTPNAYPSDTFLLLNDGILFIHNPYEIDGFASGVFAIFVPASDLRPLLKPELGLY